MRQWEQPPIPALGHIWERTQVDCSGVVWPSVFGSITVLCLALCARSENLLLVPRNIQGFPAKSYCKVARAMEVQYELKKVLNYK